MSLEMQEGEFGVDFDLTVHDADGAAHEFTGNEIVAAYVNKKGSTPTSIGSSSIYDADDGIIRLSILEADVTTLTQGVYELRIKITGASQVLIPEPGEISVGRGVS